MIKNVFIIFALFVSIICAKEEDPTFDWYQDKYAKTNFTQDAKDILFEPLVKGTAYSIRITNFKEVAQDDKIFSQFFQFDSAKVVSKELVPFMVELELSYKTTYGNHIEKFFDRYTQNTYINGDRGKVNSVNLYFTNSASNKVIFKGYEFREKDYSTLKTIAESYNKDKLYISIKFFTDKEEPDERIVNSRDDFSNLYYDNMQNEINDKTNQEDISNNLEEIILPLRKLGAYNFEFVANNKKLYYFVLINKDEVKKIKTIKAETKWR